MPPRRRPHRARRDASEALTGESPLVTAPPPPSPPAIPVTTSLDLLCPVAVLAIAGSGTQPDAGDILWKTQEHIAAGSYGRISVGPIQKLHLNPYFTELSGRTSRYPGACELVTFKSPKQVEPWDDEAVVAAGGKGVRRTGGGRRTRSFESIPFRASLPELAFLSAPELLYHENIVDILGFFWEPHGTAAARAAPAPTLILEFADQGSLRSFYSTGKTIPIGTRVGFCIDVCHALRTLHHDLSAMGKPFGLYHGDLKPENILVFTSSKTSLGWLWNTFGMSTQPDYTAKLCDLGSGVAYERDGRVKREDIMLGTVGWKAPELLSQRQTGASGVGLLDPLKTEMFSFALLVAYTIIGDDLFRIQKVASFLAEQYFHDKNTPEFLVPEGITACKDHLLKQELHEAQQWMICHHLDQFLNFIAEAIRESGFPPPTTDMVITFLGKTLRSEPDSRVSSFREACTMLGGDPDEKRTRTPLKPIVSTFNVDRLHLTTHGAVVLMNLTASMNPAFRTWLDEHFHRVFEHIRSDQNEATTELRGQIALMRGLSAFVPPEAREKANKGLAHLRSAVDLGAPHAMAVYSRLRALHQGRPSSDEELANGLVSELRRFALSVFVEEDLASLDALPDTEEEIGSELTSAMRLLQELVREGIIPSLHAVAVVHIEEEARVFIQDQLENGSSLEGQSVAAADCIADGSINYATNQAGTALMWCVARNNLAAARCLVEAGASPYTKNTGGNSPWTMAVASRLVAFVELFASSPCADPIDRQDQTRQAVFFNALDVYLACGGQFIERSASLFRRLWDMGVLSREDAYLSTVALGAASPELLLTLLDTDYQASPDESLLRQVLLRAVMFSDRVSVQHLLRRLEHFATTDFAVAVLCTAVYSNQQACLAVLEQLLNHLSPDFDINVMFTHLDIGPSNKLPRLSPDSGNTLLHFALGRGRTDAAIMLLGRGADASILSRDRSRPGIGMTPLGHMLFPRSHHSYLALRRLIFSDYVSRDHPTFILDHAILDPSRNYNIFHHLCEGENEQVHNNSDHKIAALAGLLVHCTQVAARGGPDTEQRLRELLTARLRNGEEETMAPMHVAASNGFARAIQLLAQQGVDVLDRVGGGTDGFAGFTPLFFVDQRSPAVWHEQANNKAAAMRREGFPCMDVRGPIAAKMVQDYDDRTLECEKFLMELMVMGERGAEGKAILEARRIARQRLAAS